MNILLVGHVCIDKNRTEHAAYTAAGSPAMFMSNIFGHLPGATATIMAPYGPDFLSYRGNAVLIPQSPTADVTMVYENIIRNGIRTQLCHHVDQAMPPRINTAMTQAVRSADSICVAPLAPNYSPVYLSELLTHKKIGAQVVLLPQGYFRSIGSDGAVTVREFAEAAEILPLVDVVIVSDQDHGDMWHLADTWVSTFGTTVVVTQAEHGATVMAPGIAASVPTDPVPPQDVASSVGAGDIFSAGFMYEFSSSRDPVKAARTGNRIARQCLFFTPDTLQIRYP